MADHMHVSVLIWQIADLLQGPYRPPQYGRAMLPMTVLRRLDCVLAPTKRNVIAEYNRLQDKIESEDLDRHLNRVARKRFHNHSELDFQRVEADPDSVAENLVRYIQGFSRNVREIFDFFEFENEINCMHEASILHLVLSEFCHVDLHPRRVPSEQMGLIFEDLIRRFNQLDYETAGDHFTPRDVIQLMVRILFIEDRHLLENRSTLCKLLDPACGTGGMLSEAQNYFRNHHPSARFFICGQEYNQRAFATSASDLLLKDMDRNGPENSIRFGDCLIDDKFGDMKFDYFLTNPAFAVGWKRQRWTIKHEHDKRGFDGRFGAGLPRVSDGALLFLQHMWDKREAVQPTHHKHGSRLAIVFSGSPLFTGSAGSGESEIRKWFIENDWLESIIALPEHLFHNTRVGTYIWIVSNRKSECRKGKIQLLDSRDMWTVGGSGESKRSLSGKRRHLAGSQIAAIVRLYVQQIDGERSKVCDNMDFGYTLVTVERPLRLRYQCTPNDKTRFLDACPSLLDDVQAIEEELGREPVRDWNAVSNRIANLLYSRKSRWKSHERRLFRSVFTRTDPNAQPVVLGQNSTGFEPDPSLRNVERVPLKDDIDAYFEREVLPHLPDAWIDRNKDRVGYEINFNRYFYKYTPPRPLEVIDAELKEAEDNLIRLLREVTE